VRKAVTFLVLDAFVFVAMSLGLLASRGPLCLLTALVWILTLQGLKRSYWGVMLAFDRHTERPTNEG
jgi:hypothetical protein